MSANRYQKPASLFMPSSGALALIVIWAIQLGASSTLSADEQTGGRSATHSNRLTIDRIYASKHFDGKSFSARWRKKETAFERLRVSKQFKNSNEIVREDADSGKQELIVAASDLIPTDKTEPLRIDDYAWSVDDKKLLIYTNSKRVWRRNTRGDYWLLEMDSKRLRKIGGPVEEATMMFAKLSPDGEKVAFVRNRNIFIHHLSDDRIQKLTTTKNESIINGTGDWAYEEEFGLRDGFYWSPDSRRIAYWQIDESQVGRFPLVNNTDTTYPKVQWFGYPKVGQRNPACRVGVAECQAGKTVWMNIPGDPRQHYLPRMQWANNATQVLVQQLNRRQNHNRLWLCDVVSGKGENIFTDQDDAWLEIHDELFWLEDGKSFTWISERDGWRHAYLVSRQGEARLLTKGEFDVIKLLQVNEQDGSFYFIASPENPTERYLYRGWLDRSEVERVTPANLAGVHDYKFSSDMKWALHSSSSFDSPKTTRLIRLPDHSTHRVLENNNLLSERLAKTPRTPSEFFRVEVGENVELDGWCIKPPNFDPKKKYPLLVYVYGEPAGSTVINRWGGKSYLWHTMLAQQGYIVMSFDNRGARAPRGRAWRKSIYRKIGILGPQDQAAAVRAVLRERPYIDPNRVGIWGWSGGGSSSLQAIFKYPELYRTAIAIAAVPNQRYYDTMYQERYMDLLENNLSGYRDGSPINFAKQLKGNLLLVHGSGDDNCHYQTVELLIDKLVAHNKHFNMMTYPNRSHSISERRNTTRHLRALMTRYLQEHLPATKND